MADILDFLVGLPEVWGSNPGGGGFVNYTVSGKKRPQYRHNLDKFRHNVLTTVAKLSAGGKARASSASVKMR